MGETVLTPGTLPTATDSVTSHSKIISEVLKKYPDLVKENRNIKLKIVQKGQSDQPSKEAKSKVSYIVLKSTSFPDSAGSVVLKRSRASPNKFWDSHKPPSASSAAAENVTGPWTCSLCGDGENSPLEFESYYKYRRHLSVSIQNSK
jgi:hypothetical protein